MLLPVPCSQESRVPAWHGAGLRTTGLSAAFPGRFLSSKGFVQPAGCGGFAAEASGWVLAPKRGSERLLAMCLMPTQEHPAQPETWVIIEAMLYAGRGPLGEPMAPSKVGACPRLLPAVLLSSWAHNPGRGARGWGGAGGSGWVSAPSSSLSSSSSSSAANLPGGTVQSAGQPRQQPGGAGGGRAADQELAHLQGPRHQGPVPAAMARHRRQCPQRGQELCESCISLLSCLGFWS